MDDDITKITQQITQFPGLNEVTHNLTFALSHTDSHIVHAPLYT